MSSPATGSAPATESAAVARLIGRADAICKRVDTKLVTASSGQLDLRAIARSAPRNAALERTALTELDKLTAPASLALDWAKIIAYRRTLAHELVELGRAAKANNERAVRALGVSKARVHEELTAIATRDGFKHCAQASSGTGGAAAQSPAPQTRSDSTRTGG